MLYTREAGDPHGPAIIFLHGGGLSSAMWQPQFERLADFYCLAPDLPEQGQSAGIRPFDLDDAAQRVAEVIRARAPGGRGHVVGLSLGGATALALMRLAPETIKRAMVSGTAARLGGALGLAALATLPILRLYKRERLVEATLKQQGIPERYRDLVYPDLLQTATESFNRTTIRALMAMQVPTDYRGPVLVAVGARETAPARQAAHKLAATLPGAVGVRVPGLGHIWNLQDPDLFSDAVRAWVTEAALPPRLQRL